MIKTTTKQLKVFEKAVREWQQKLSLNDWVVNVTMADLDSFARVRYDADQHHAVIELATEMQEPATDRDIVRYALHECLHLRLAQLTALIPTQLAQEASHLEHAVVRNFENIFLGP